MKIFVYQVIECRKSFKGTISMATAEEEEKFLEKEEALLAKKKLKTEKKISTKK